MKYDGKFSIDDIYDMIKEYGTYKMAIVSGAPVATLYNWVDGKTHRRPTRKQFVKVLKVLGYTLNDVRY